MTIIRIYNRDTQKGVYVGRGSIFGNPYRIGPDGTRDEVVKKFRDYLVSNENLMALVKRDLVGKDLSCFCAPANCHARVLAFFANATSGDMQVEWQRDHTVLHF